MAGHVIAVNDCRRQGVGLYWSWRHQRDSTSNVRAGGIPEKLYDVTPRFRGFRRDHAGSRVEPDRRTRDRNPPAGRRTLRLDPLIRDPDRSPDQCRRMPRQRRRGDGNLIASLDVANAGPRDDVLCTSCGNPMTSRTTIGDVTTLSRDDVTSRTNGAAESRSPYVPPLTLLTPVPRRRRHRDPASWSRSTGVDWDATGFLESPGRMSCFQLELVEELIEKQRNLSLVQVTLGYRGTIYACCFVR